MSDHPIPDLLRSEHLFLLVGTNPLPNLIAARLLAKDGATVWLLHTGETLPAAQALEGALRKEERRLKPQLHQIDSADSGKIVSEVQAVLKTLLKHNPPPSIGLNYSGGTKPMSVHAYRAIEKAIAEYKQKSLPCDDYHPVFSYLDPRALALRIDPVESTEEGVERSLLKDPILPLVTIELDDLARLHGYKRMTKAECDALHPERATLSVNRPQPDLTPELFALCQAIGQVNAYPKAASGHPLTPKDKWDKWLKTNPFNALPDDPDLKDIAAALNYLCVGAATPDLVAQKFKVAQFTACRDWFNGFWLEDYALACLLKLQQSGPFRLHGCANNLFYGMPGTTEECFELDVAAMLGYQWRGWGCPPGSGRRRRCWSTRRAARQRR